MVETSNVIASVVIQVWQQKSPRHSDISINRSLNAGET